MTIARLSEDERADIEYDLADTRERLNDLLCAEPVSPEAAARRDETVGKVRVSIARFERLLSSDGASQ